MSFEHYFVSEGNQQVYRYRENHLILERNANNSMDISQYYIN